MKYKRGEEICDFCGCVCSSRSVISNHDDSVYICDSCISDCYDLLDKYNLIPHNKNFEDEELEFNYKPKEIVKMLNKYIIGQEEAKKTLAVSIYNHYKRIRLAKRKIFIQKSNVLMLGPTGSGKTYLLKTLAQILDVPFMIVDSSQITPSGYKGDDLSNSWLRLYNKCGRSKNKMKNAIIYFDEIDKLIFRSSSTNDFYSVVQSEFLKILEDSEIIFTDHNKEEIAIDSSGMLFVFGGAFAGLEKIIEKRLGIEKKSVIGFNNTNEVKKDTNIFNKVTLDDLREFGVIPEFMGRISSIVTLNALTEQDLVDILVKPKNSIISQYKAMFLEDGVSLDFEEEAIKSIAKKAIEKETGARGLRAIIEDKMLNLMYELPSDNKVVSCTITKSFIEGKTKKPKLVKYEENKVLKLNY